MHSSFRTIAFLYFVIGVLSQYKQCGLDLFPLPQQCNIGVNETLLLPDPCLTLFRIYGGMVHPHFLQITEFQMQKTFHCQSVYMVARNASGNQTLYNNTFQFVVDVVASDSVLRNPVNISQETYIINMTSKSALLYVATYPAYVRALETYLQLFKYDKTSESYLVKNLPLSIADQPRFSHRGVMIDTARHYLPYQLILDTIDSLAYNKLNVLHWHITDEDSFPLVLESHPQLAEFGAFSDQKVYTVEQVKEMIRYGMIRGVRIIPELDTPGHAASWGLAPQNKGIACVIDNWGYWGGLDVTLSRTYEVINEVFKEVMSLFPDRFIHLGGDQVQLTCFKNISQLTKSQNVSQQHLQEYYRRRQKQIITELNQSKQTIYWVNDHNFKAQKGDVIQWWGGSTLPNTTAKVIVSMYGPYYLDMGVGNIFAQPYGLYSTWLDLYQQNLATQIANYTNKQNVIGGEVLLWSELSNEYTHMVKLWVRSSSFAERMWNPNIEVIKPRVLSRLNTQMKRLNAKGIPTAPIASQKCETYPQFC